MMQEAKKTLIEAAACAQVRNGDEDADYVCCALVDLALVTTDAELIQWIEEYRALVSDELLERVLGATSMGVAV